MKIKDATDLGFMKTFNAEPLPFWRTKDTLHAPRNWNRATRSLVIQPNNQEISGPDCRTETPGTLEYITADDAKNLCDTCFRKRLRRNKNSTQKTRILTAYHLEATTYTALSQYEKNTQKNNINGLEKFVADQLYANKNNFTPLIQKALKTIKENQTDPTTLQAEIITAMFGIRTTAIANTKILNHYEKQKQGKAFQNTKYAECYVKTYIKTLKETKNEKTATSEARKKAKECAPKLPNIETLNETLIKNLKQTDTLKDALQKIQTEQINNELDELETYINKQIKTRKTIKTAIIRSSVLPSWHPPMKTLLKHIHSIDVRAKDYIVLTAPTYIINWFESHMSKLEYVTTPILVTPKLNQLETELLTGLLPQLRETPKKEIITQIKIARKLAET